MRERVVTGAVAALCSALDRGIIEPPSPDEEWLCLNARPLGHETRMRANLLCEQGFRPQFNNLADAGYRTVPEFPEDIAQRNAAILFSGRNAALNRRNLARAWKAVIPGGLVIVAGEKTCGIAALKRWSEERCDVEGHYSKHHAQLFWMRRAGGEFELTAALREIGGYVIGHGMFSSDGPDPGSVMLAGHFDRVMSGKIADLGAGWGYLGTELLKRGGKIDRLDSYEADWMSLQASRGNLASHAGDTLLGFNWTDIIGEETEGGYDHIVMNPPFHSGREADPGIGETFIARAAAMLNPGGRLLMVANRKLPYERQLRRQFRQTFALGEDMGFKLFEARR